MTLRINLDLALCRTQHQHEAYLWDSELDGGTRNARGETRRDRQARHERAKSICSACPQRLVCLEVGLRDQYTSGIYGGELVEELRRPSARPSRRSRLHA